ncbi:alkene reductase [Parapedomonas caeni]
MPTLFDPCRLGALALANRVVMAPMTRSRADAAGVPTDCMVDYYAQRASAGLIVSEGIQPSEEGQGYCRTPGLHNAAQVAAWRRVTDAVHAGGGRIVAQLMHCGRIGSHLNKAAGARTVAPSAIQAPGRIFTDAAGMVAHDMPEALTVAGIAAVIDEFATAARLALEAGFDGVELHAASGYLPMQFLSTGTNQRQDAYGGSVGNRVRFVVEVMDAMASAIGADRVGIRICPGNPFNGITDADPAETYATLLDALPGKELSYLHLVDLRQPALDVRALVGEHWRGALILNESIDYRQAEALVASGAADAVAFGRPFIANPDLVARLRAGASLAAFDPARLYTPGPEGYSDYPAMAPSGA